MAPRNAAVAIMVARSGNHFFYLTLKRDSRGKWANALMLGPAETREPKDAGRYVPTLFRGLSEEIKLERKDILSVTPHLMMVESGRDFKLPDKSPSTGRKIPDSHNYKAHFFWVEVSLPTLKDITKKINKGVHSELRAAAVHRGLPALLRATLFHPSTPPIQPHTRMVLERLAAERTRHRNPPFRDGVPKSIPPPKRHRR